jgi:hypothetical protein
MITQQVIDTEEHKARRAALWRRIVGEVGVRLRNPAALRVEPASASKLAAGTRTDEPKKTRRDVPRRQSLRHRRQVRADMCGVATSAVRAVSRRRRLSARGDRRLITIGILSPPVTPGGLCFARRKRPQCRDHQFCAGN